MHMYCLFCQTQKTEQIAQLIMNIHRDATEQSIRKVECISPKIVQRCWVQGREEQRVHSYLPGYLFLYTREPLTEFAHVRRLTGVIRLLGQREEGYELSGPDRSFAQMIYNMQGTIGIMKTIQVGDRVQLDEDLYAGFTGEVIRLDRRKGRAQIRFEFDGSVQNVWVGYEMVKRETPAEEKRTEKRTEDKGEDTKEDINGE